MIGTDRVHNDKNDVRWYAVGFPGAAAIQNTHEANGGKSTKQGVQLVHFHSHNISGRSKILRLT